MSVIKKESIGTSIIFFVGVLLGYVNLIFIYPYCLSVEQIGLLKLLLSLSTFFASFVPLGSPNITIKYFPKFTNSKSETKDFLGYLLILPILGFGVFFLLYSLFDQAFLALYKEESSEITYYMTQFLLLIIFISYYRVLLGYSSSLFKTIVPTFLKETYLRLVIPIALFLYFFDYLTYRGAINLIVGFYFSVTFLLMVYLMVNQKFGFSFSKRFYQNWKLQKELFTYGGFIMLSNSGQIIVRNLDLMMIGALLGLKETGIYSIVYIMGQVVEIPKRAISRISSAVVARKWEENKVEEIQSIYQKTSLTNFLVGGFIFIGVWTNLQDLFNLMPQGEEFRSGTYVVLFIGLAKVFSMVAGNNGEILMTSKYYWFSFVSIFLLALTTFFFNYLLIPIFGLEGAALATFICLVLNNFIISGFLFLKFKLTPLSLNTFFAFLFLCILLITANFLPLGFHPLFNIMVRSTMLVGLFVFGIIYLPLSVEIKGLIQSKFINLFGKR